MATARKNTPANQAAKAATATAAATKPATVTVAAVRYTGTLPTKPYRTGSARALYLASFIAYCKAHAGTGGWVTVAALNAHWAANTPSTPKTGKLAGCQEPIAGWLGYLTRVGVCANGTVKVPATG